MSQKCTEQFIQDKYGSGKVLIEFAIIFNYILVATPAPAHNQCDIPTDLNVEYQRLTSTSIGNNVFLSVEMAPTERNQSALTNSDKSCPTSSGYSNIIHERSTCPWYFNVTHDSTIFPPSLTEVVCRCRKCLGSNDNQCVMVFTSMTVLKRTGQCVGGLYVYRPSVIQVATACACVRKVDVVNERNMLQYES
ncbi:interleukin 17-like protein isoform X1 [Octopus bimaculoides]|uniref:interleukin 17-like protein isoform X1 n=1 Tax=Octopus bimaculoides TaxID=37653 RepID=UPI00071CE517|nr:interleukin 17-like protein isoform X1 [Octopus bimaculoides]|eukprot:XP_014769320.1 PREDICTED: interleukin 17-like protein [Octopus bimaculoides]